MELAGRSVQTEIPVKETLKRSGQLLKKIPKGDHWLPHTCTAYIHTHTHRGLITYIKIANDLGTFEHILKNTQNNAKTEPQFLSLCI